MRTLLIGIVSVAALAQTASFEAATIKPAGPEETGISGGDGRNGVLKIWNMNLRQCIGSAYRVPESLVVGGPPWVRTVGYDILAKADQPLNEAELFLMLRPLLENRFQLKVHRESRTVPGYALTVAKGGILAKVSDPARHSSSNGGRGFIDSAGNGWGALAIRLTGLLGRPVVDETGDKRHFEFHLRWTPDEVLAGGTSPNPEAPSLLTALREQLGLKVEARKVQVQVIVVDHAEPPSAN
ncbi:MAG TPA: TIGR03435 family protein [Bryobacteraceae bacterium]|nr:TIGR03435 family protein [Bryobacteraceae bacterium]